ncbi:hypothetical protein Q4603_02180 [Zobellia galactanivorans]|uniref:Putative membrane lipoprotein n=1 Tax=Zobellia galactanivorans (strain DSM 12802 / CCUG 47099 / CIP 106680 / NCIMB 13871 / Dsij) TaxID=63186 RepID=G0L5L1_ZOBGA|nr:MULTISPECIES: hypothetical protein [Zobellia]MDO6517297.1 hypothetical protein [Zobellia uliginosa]MDO6807392.1 hypothetical protein [Zobellia galactanivorans]CAZ96345.1 Putative membrane lipoprotein [Zobellia galactanivorans]
MKKVYIATLVVIMNGFLFSCSSPSTADTDELYHIQATEGDDGDPPTDPPRG